MESCHADRTHIGGLLKGGGGQRQSLVKRGGREKRGRDGRDRNREGKMQEVGKVLLLKGNIGNVHRRWAMYPVRTPRVG